MDMGVKLSSKDVAKHLGIEPVTVRKYASMLEEQGYSFNKDSKGWRLYTEDDVKTLEYLCTMTKINGHSLDETVKHIASLYRSKLTISDTATSLQDNPLVEFMKRQEEFNQRMGERMEQFEKRQHERHETLTAALRKSLETQRMIATTKQKK
nr:MerR family transcriptional regulator [Bacillus velezensis]